MYERILNGASYAKLADYHEQLRRCEQISLLKAPLYSEAPVTPPATKHPARSAVRQLLNAGTALLHPHQHRRRPA